MSGLAPDTTEAPAGQQVVITVPPDLYAAMRVALRCVRVGDFAEHCQGNTYPDRQAVAISVLESIGAAMNSAALQDISGPDQADVQASPDAEKD